MKMYRRALIGTNALLLLVFFLRAILMAQTIGTKDGVRIVHNVKGGVWGASPKVALKLVRNIGDVDTEDENLAFNAPGDIVEDRDGNIYVSDSRDCRIIKFDKDGKFIVSFGRKGQGPGEFSSMSSLDIDSAGNLYILDVSQRRIQVLSGDGKQIKTVRFLKSNVDRFRLIRNGLYFFRESIPGPRSDAPKMLLKIIDETEAVRKEFCQPVDFGEAGTNQVGNSVHFTVGQDGSLAVNFIYQNRIEKYSPEGTLIWKADRPLNFETKVIEKGKYEVTANSSRYTGPKMNFCSKGITFDSAGRIWVVTYRRQPKPEEIIGISTYAGPSGVSVKKTGNTDLRMTDMYELEVFNPEGVLLGAIPLSHFVDGIWIYKDRLYLLDRDRGVTYYQYRIIDK